MMLTLVWFLACSSYVFFSKDQYWINFMIVGMIALLALKIAEMDGYISLSGF